MPRVNLNKLARVEELAFKNALKLHYDSIALFKKRSYASSHYLSVLALEEMGKAFILSDLIFYAITSQDAEIRRFPLYAEQLKQIDYILSHHRKQVAFVRQASDIFSKPPKYLSDILSGKTEILKQNSVYVGLKRSKGKIDIMSQISTPNTIGRAFAVKQITAVNDFLLTYILAVIKGVYSYDNQNVEHLLNKNLFRKLTEIWKNRTYACRRKLEWLN